MTNTEIAAVFWDIAALLKTRKENIFKIRAYEKAAKSIEGWEGPVEQLALEGRLRVVSGVGNAIEKKITELVKTGHLEFYDRLKGEADGTRK